MMSQEFSLPTIPTESASYEVLLWLREPGDQLTQGDPLVLVRSPHAEWLIPSPATGQLDAQLVATGAQCSLETPIVRIMTASHSPASPSSPPSPPMRISPVARRIAAAAGVELSDVTGSGPSGRILKRDVLAAGIESVPTSPPVAPSTATPPSDVAHPTAPLIEAQMQHCSELPIAMSALEVDMCAIHAFCQRADAGGPPARTIAPTPLACIAYIALAALRHHPQINSAWTERGILMRRRVHLAFLGGTSTTVIADAQDLNVRGLTRALSRQADSGTQACTFAIATLAAANWLATPPPPPGASCLLGIGPPTIRPIVLADRQPERIATRPIVVLTLAFDARLIDQAQADQFLCDIQARIEQFEHENLVYNRSLHTIVQQHRFEDAVV